MNHIIDRTYPNTVCNAHSPVSHCSQGNAYTSMFLSIYSTRFKWICTSPHSIWRTSQYFAHGIKNRLKTVIRAEQINATMHFI